MSKFILNPETVLIIDAEVYYLVREKKQSNNDVCKMCSLQQQCWVVHSAPRYMDLCIPKTGYEGWFFTTNVLLTEYKAKSLVELINETFSK